MFVVIGSQIGACSATAEEECKWESFRSLPEPEKHKVLDICTPERRVDLYVKWSFSTYPPNTDLAERLASYGEQIVPAIIARIETVGSFGDEGPKPELVHLLLLMHVRGYHPVANDSATMRRLSTAIALIPDEPLREDATAVLEDLRRATFGEHRRQ